MRLFIGLMCLCFLVSCQTAKSKVQKDQMEEAVSAFGTMAEGLANQNVSREDLKKVGIRMQKDPEVKSAVQSINQALNVQQTGVKYCPKDGQRFASSVDICPIHKVQLKVVE